jgi:hypothetical protein
MKWGGDMRRKDTPHYEWGGVDGTHASTVVAGASHPRASGQGMGSVTTPGFGMMPSGSAIPRKEQGHGMGSVLTPGFGISSNRDRKPLSSLSSHKAIEAHASMQSLHDAHAHTVRHGGKSGGYTHHGDNNVTIHAAANYNPQQIAEAVNQRLQKTREASVASHLRSRMSDHG